MSEFVHALAQVEERTDWHVIRDLQTANMDVISFRVNVDSARDGTIPLRKGVKLFESARDALVAAARSAVEARPLFLGGAPGEVARYLKKVRVGQTEHGSYIVNLLSPVATLSPQQTEPDIQLFEDRRYESEVHFSRSVTTMLHKALRSTREAAEKSRNDPSYRAFVNAVHSGVSANLCEALVNVYESGGEQAIHVNLRWAYTLRQHDQQGETFDFDSEYIPVLREAAAVLREVDPYENYLLQGEIISLRRDKLRETGRVAVKGKVDDKERQVLVHLESSDYSNALTAHDVGAIVSVRGRLRNRGTQWFLENPTNFLVLDDRTFPYDGNL